MIANWSARAPKIAGAYRRRTLASAERLPPAGRTVTTARMTAASRNTTWYRPVRPLPVAENRPRTLKYGHLSAETWSLTARTAPKEGTNCNEDSPRTHRHCPRGPRRPRGGYRRRRQVALRKVRP